MDEDYHRDYSKRHYETNKAYYLEKNKKARLKKVQYIRDLKSEASCADCGEDFPHYVMEFDHRDPSEKVAAVSTLVSSSWKKLYAEIDKCDVVCANCHRARTWGRGGMEDTLALEASA